MEIAVEQRSEDWYQLRKSRQLTASRFGDAIGVGKGKPYHFFLSLLQPEEEAEEQGTRACLQHGIDLEPAIHAAYKLLTNAKTRESGFWVPSENDAELKDLIGASPDAIVMNGASPAGLCEFKAPIHRMYPKIPRCYMAQIQGQIAVTGLPWCDFMAVCCKTKEITLHRVYFCSEYWSNVKHRLVEFCNILKEARSRIILGQSGTDFEEVKRLRNWEISERLLPGEEQIKTENLLKQMTKGEFQGPSGVSYNFDSLINVNMIHERHSDRLAS